MNSKLINKLEKIIDVLFETPAYQSAELQALEEAVDKVLITIKATPETKMNSINTENTIYIWSDGACSGNPGPGGWGTLVEIEGQLLEYSGGSRKTTNNIMEMTGALEGIKSTPEGCTIVLTSDSQYLVKGMTQWLKGWKKKGWKKADGKDVLNKEIWLELDKESSKRSIRWQWIKGHAGHPENERCDELARQAIPQ